MINKICAGIVLYNPDFDRLKANIEAISTQVDEVVVVDNCSQNKHEIIEFFRDYKNAHIIWNKSNAGIAAALNQIADYAKINLYSWAILLDQDSVVDDDIIYKYSFYFDDIQVAIICPQIIDINHTTSESTGVEQVKCSTDVITSGSCIRIDDWFKLGGFNEELFIDFVDTDYQERCLRSGRKIIKINDAHLYHEIGSLKERHFLFFKVLCSNHNSMRRYYMVRNRLFFRYHYFGKFSFFIEYLRLLLGTFKIIIFEDHKTSKIKSFICGVRDAKKLIQKRKNTEEKNKRISIILPSAFGTGGINVLYEYGRRLSRHGIKVTYYIPLIAYNMHRGNLFVDILKQIYASIKLGIIYYIKREIYKIRINEQADIRLVPRIKKSYLKNADFVIASAWVTAFDVVKLPKNKGEHLYFVQDYEVWDNEKLGKESYKLPLRKIVIAKWIKEKLVNECGCDSDDIEIINNGIDIRIYNNPQKDYKNTDVINCLMLDHKLRKKGVKEGIMAFLKARETCPNISMTMFGITKSSDVPSWTKYYENPDRQTIVRLYREADVFIFPSLEEGWGLTPIEAMASKCAVVGSRVGCMLDIGKDGENVLLSEPGDIDGMANNLIMIITDQEIRKSISEEGYKTVKELDWEKSTELLLSALKL